MTAEKLLIVGPAWVGDMVMAQSLFIQLKRLHPEMSIDVIAPEWSRPLLERMPEVRRALPLPFRHGEFHLRKRRAIGKSLRKEQYDRAIVLPNSFKSALVPFFARIPKRTGWRGEMRYGLLNDCRVLNKTKMPLMVERFVALADQGPLPAEMPRPALKINPEQQALALQKFGLDQSKSILALCPGAEFGPAKRWPETQYAEVAQEKLNEGWQVWLFGSEKDKPVCEAINQACGHQCVDISGKTSLAEAIDILACANMVVSNDSGLMHIAAALSRPLVVLYGSSDPRHTPPLSERVKILSLGLSCSPCFKRECPLEHLNCLRQLPAQYVKDAMKVLLT